MVTVREYDFDELGDPDAPQGSKEWSVWVANEIRKALHDAEFSGQTLRTTVEMFKTHAAYRYFNCQSWEEYCKQRLHKPAEAIEGIITYRIASQHGGDRRSHTFQLDNYQVEPPSANGGTDSSYLTARIARDNPDILNDMKAGKYRSVRQAAIAAGIVKPERRVSIPLDPHKAATLILRNFTAEQVAELIDFLITQEAA